MRLVLHIAVAVLGAAFLVPSGSAQEARSPDLASPSQSSAVPGGVDTPGFNLAVEKIENAIRSLKVESDKREAERKEQREKDELVAQQEMSASARDTLVLTRIGTGFTAIGFLAILGTLFFTGSAAKSSRVMAQEAAHTSKAAYLTVAATREVGHAQVRPYVGIKNTFIEPVNGGEPRLRIHLENYGVSPALRVHCRAFYYRPAVSGGSSDYVRELPRQRAKFVLFGGELRGTSFDIAKPDYEHILVSVNVTYADINGQLYRTREALRLIRRGADLAFETYGPYSRVT